MHTFFEQIFHKLCSKIIFESNIFNYAFLTVLLNIAILASLLSKSLVFCEIPKKSAKLWRNFANSAVSFENQQEMRGILQKLAQKS